MNNIIEPIEALIGVGVTIASTYAGFVAWNKKQKAHNSETLEMLFEQMDVLRQKVILQAQKEIVSSSTIAKQNVILQGLKDHCPECYNDYMRKYHPNESI